jgi:L-lactate dehydrogenase complex protein LldG
MNAGREPILGRVRAALRTPAPRPPAPTDSAIWPPLGEVMERFRQEFTLIKGELLDTPDQLRDFLKPFSKIATDGSELVQKTVGAGSVGVREAELGVTGCDCLVAQTGSIFVCPRSAGGRAMSVLPPVHLVIARRDQLVPDLVAAFALVRQRYDGNWPSTFSLISGPSRTADIEKILVMGAHGPKRLVVHFCD